MTQTAPAIEVRQGSSGSPITDDSISTFEDIVTAMSDQLGSSSLSEAMRQAAFFLCAMVIAQDTAKARLELYDISGEGYGRLVKPTEHPVAALLFLQPNARHTWTEYLTMMGFWTATVANGFAFVERNLMGEALELIPVQWGRILEIFIPTSRAPVYEVLASTYQELSLMGGRSSQIVLPENAIHIRRNMVDGMNGFSTLVAGRDALSTSDAIADYRNELFTDDAQVRGVFERTLDGVLPEEAYNRLRNQLAVMMRRFQQNSQPIVLEGGLKFQAIAVNPKDAELTAQFKTSVLEMCRLFRVPPHKVFELDGIKYENLEAMERIYAADTMEPLLAESEERHTRALLTPRERLTLRLRHNRRAFLLRDTKAETDRVSRLVERGVIKLNEGRMELGYNPIPGGDVRLVPSNMNVVDDNNEVILAASGKGNGAGQGGDTTAPAGA